jgi:hypothetical protein
LWGACTLHWSGEWNVQLKFRFAAREYKCYVSVSIKCNKNYEFKTISLNSDRLLKYSFNSNIWDSKAIKLWKGILRFIHSFYIVDCLHNTRQQWIARWSVKTLFLTSPLDSLISLLVHNHWILAVQCILCFSNGYTLLYKRDRKKRLSIKGCQLNIDSFWP